MLKIGISEPVPIDISDEESGKKSRGKVTKTKTILRAAVGKRPDDEERATQKSHDFTSWEDHKEIDDAEMLILYTQQMSDQQVGYSSGQESVTQVGYPSGQDSSQGSENDEMDGSGPDVI